MPVRIVTNPWLLPWAQVLAPFELPYSVWSAGSLLSQLQVRPRACPNHPNDWITRMELRQLLLCAGISQAPSSAPGDLTAWGFLIEHHNSFVLHQGTLRAVDSAAVWDSRAKGLFAERIGVGLAAWLLWRDFGVVHLADAPLFIARTLLNPVSPYHRVGLRLLIHA